MNHTEIEPLLTAYLLGDLDEVRSTMVKEHVATCDACKTEIAELEGTIGLLKQALAAKPTPNTLSPERLQKILSTKPKKVIPFFSWFTQYHPTMARAASFMLVCVLVWTLVKATLKSGKTSNTVEPIEFQVAIPDDGESKTLPESRTSASGRLTTTNEVTSVNVVGYYKVDKTLGYDLVDSDLDGLGKSIGHAKPVKAPLPAVEVTSEVGSGRRTDRLELPASQSSESMLETQYDYYARTSPEPNQTADYFGFLDEKSKKDGGSGGPALPAESPVAVASPSEVGSGRWTDRLGDDASYRYEPTTRSRESLFELNDDSTAKDENGVSHDHFSLARNELATPPPANEPAPVLAGGNITGLKPDTTYGLIAGIGGSASISASTPPAFESADKPQIDESLAKVDGQVASLDQDGEIINYQVTPEYKDGLNGSLGAGKQSAPVGQVADLAASLALDSVQSLTDTDLDAASKKLDAQLKQDPYNSDAIQLRQKVAIEKYDRSTTELNESRQSMMVNQRNTWDPGKYAGENATPDSSATSAHGGLGTIDFEGDASLDTGKPVVDNFSIPFSGYMDMSWNNASDAEPETLPTEESFGVGQWSTPATSLGTGDGVGMRVSSVENYDAPAPDSESAPSEEPLERRDRRLIKIGPPQKKLNEASQTSPMTIDEIQKALNAPQAPASADISTSGSIVSKWERVKGQADGEEAVPPEDMQIAILGVTNNIGDDMASRSDSLSARTPEGLATVQHQASIELAEKKLAYEQVEGLSQDVMESSAQYLTRDPSVVTLVSELRKSEVELKELRGSLGANHPDLVKAQSKLEELKSKRDQAFKELKVAYETEYKMAQARHDAASKNLEEAQMSGQMDDEEAVLPADMQIAQALSGTSNTTYYYRFYGSNAIGRIWSKSQTVLTNTAQPDLIAMAKQSDANQVHLWNGNGWKSYWLDDGHTTPSDSLNRRWWDPSANTYANIKIEPGQAFFFWNETNRYTNHTFVRPSTNFKFTAYTHTSGDAPIAITRVPLIPAIKKEEDTTGPRFKAFGVNPFVNTVENTFSTFSIDVDTASYTVMRNYVAKGFLPPAEAVRTEEFVNFFDYGYKAPTHDTFQIFADCAPSKFGHGMNLLKVGVKGLRLGREQQKPSVLTFLIDTSGSMDTPDRLGLVKKSLKLLVTSLSPKDKICIIQYNTHARIVLEMTAITDINAILAAIDSLECSGSTNLEEAMKTAYSVASANIMPGAENRVLLLSDGVANLGTDKADDILNMVAHSRHQGLFCSVLGFGIGTYDDAMLEALANRGDGVYTFIDSEDEAKRVLVDDLSATLNTIAADVKIQVEFNPAYVAKYRQLGYENRQLKKQDFRNDTVDAGEIGSGQAVTALYELSVTAPVRPNRITPPEPIATIRVRYRRLDTGKIEEIEKTLTQADVLPSFDQAGSLFKLAACVAEFSEILRGSPHAEGSTCSGVAEVMRPVAQDLYLDKRVQEFMQVIQGASSLPRGE